MSAVLLQKQQAGEMCSRIQNGVLCPNIYFRQISILKFMNSQMRMQPAWLHCVASHRRPTLSVDWAAEWQDYDILAGKVANDRTNPTITAYLAGLFGEVGSMRADEQCVSMLMPENLENQICLRTPAALACISFEGSEKVVCR